jgi:hypothetical protein
MTWLKGKSALSLHPLTHLFDFHKRLVQNGLYMYKPVELTSDGIWVRHLGIEPSETTTCQQKS